MIVSMAVANSVVQSLDEIIISKLLVEAYYQNVRRAIMSPSNDKNAFIRKSTLRRIVKVIYCSERVSY